MTCYAGAIVAVVSLVVLADARTAPATCDSEDGCEPTPPEPNFNNRRLVRVQAMGAPSEDEIPDATTTLTYMGHSSFKVTSPNGIEVLVDPWQNDASGFWGLWYYKLYPMTRTDIMISTHNHFDHNAFDRVESPMNLDRMVGRFFLGDVEIEGIADKHAIGKYEDGLFNELGLEKNPPNNVALLDNVIFRVKVGGVTIVFWGDNRPNPEQHVWDKLAESKIDFAVLPIDDSSHLMPYDDVETILRHLQPRAVVPVHYLMDNGLGSVLSKLLPCDAWLATHRDRLIDLKSATIALDQTLLGKLDQKKYTTLYFGSHLPFDVSDLDSATPKDYVCKK
eukprot:m.313600 g.313600  ORF g.313600 m.313600 type:complete len:335 (-) comp27485_c0_seq4:292-1296(-)